MKFSCLNAVLAAALVFAQCALAQDPSPPELRLPQGVRPLAYSAELTLRPEAGEFSGKIQIDIELSKPAAVIWLNSRFLSVQRAWIEGRGSAIPAHVVAGGPDFTGLRFDAPLAAGRASLHLEYRGEVSDKDSTGIFRLREGGDWYLFTQFEPLYARRAFPSFDEPGYKVPWQLALVVAQDQLAVANTPALSETALPGGMKRVTFARTRPLPSYLIAFAVGPFDVVDGGSAGAKRTPLRYITPRGMGARTRYAAQVTPRLLEMLEAYVGMPYPYEKLDSIAVPQRSGGGGAMENPGLVTYSMNLLLARPQDETPRTRQAYAHIGAHEIAHMWFGNLVTHAWWDDLWLNESFATWLSGKIAARLQPEWEIPAKEALSRNWAMKNDGLIAARRIRQPIDSNNDIANAFDPITYAKGSAVLEMFENWLGEEKFRAILQGYLARHADGVATGADFLAALNGGAGAEAGAAFATFLEQTGLPLVGLELQCTPGDARLRLSQRRYLPLGSRGQATQIWRMPVCVRHGTGGEEQRACTLMTGAQGEIPLGATCPAWVRPEPARYYRAHYEGKTVTQGGNSAVLDAVTEIGDLHALALNGGVNLADALTRVQSHAGRASRDVIQSLTYMLYDLRPLVSPELRTTYTQWVRRQFGPQAQGLGLASRAGDSEDAQRLRPALLGLLAYDGDDKDLQAKARALALRWIEDRNAVDANMIETVLQAAAYGGDKALFERLRSALEETTDRRERRLIFTALGSFTDPALGKAALAMLLDPGYDYRESAQIAWTMADRLDGGALVIDYMKANFNAMVARAPRDAAAWFPRWGATGCDMARHADIEGFFKERAARFTGGPRVLAQTLEQISLCAAFREGQQASLAQFLRTP